MGCIESAARDDHNVSCVVVPCANGNRTHLSCLVCHAQTLAQMSQPSTRWSLKKSVFAPRLGEADSHDFLDTPRVLAAAFEADWRLMKVCVTHV